MIKIRSIILSGFVLFFVLMACQKKQSIQLITPEEYQDLEEFQTVQLLDVRSVKKFQELHIKGAQNLIYDQDFSEKIKLLDKTKPVAVYCSTGGLSKVCVETLKDSGFIKIYDLKGGLAKWKYSGIALDSIN